jgi:hypothetical protein
MVCVDFPVTLWALSATMLAGHMKLSRCEPIESAANAEMAATVRSNARSSFCLTARPSAFVALASLPIAAVLLVEILTVHLQYGLSSIKLLAVTQPRLYRVCSSIVAIKALL